MKHPSLEREYGVVRFKGIVQCHGLEELVFQSDDAFEAMEHLEKECVADGVVHQHRIIFKDDNS